MRLGGVALVVAVGVTACGRVNFDPLERDAAGRTCLDAWRSGAPQLGTVVHLSSLATAEDERDPYLARDGLTLYFSRGVTGTYDIVRATRAAPGARFDDIQIVTELASTVGDNRLSLTGDGLVGYFASARTGSVGTDVWRTTRATSTAPFTAPDQTYLAAVNGTGNDLDPFVSPDDLRLYVSPGSPQQYIAVARRDDATVPFQPPTMVEGVTIAIKNADPALTDDERVIVFTAGDIEAGLDLYVAVRPERDLPFSGVTVLGISEPDVADSDPVLSANGCELFFASARAGGAGALDLWAAIVEPG